MAHRRRKGTDVAKQELTYDAFIAHLTESEKVWSEQAKTSPTACQLVKFHRQLLVALVEMRELIGHFVRYPEQDKYVKVDIRPQLHKLTKAFADIKVLEEQMGPSSPVETLGSVEALADKAIEIFTELRCHAVDHDEAKRQAIERLIEEASTDDLPPMLKLVEDPDAQ